LKLFTGLSWGPNWIIFDGGQAINCTDLHLADWDGDGACDIILVDSNPWRNTVKNTGKVQFDTPVAISNFSCDQPPGVGVFDLAVRFADLN
jgi:hypothetical protein